MSPRDQGGPKLEPIERAARGVADAIERALDGVLPGERVGYALFLYTFGEGGWMTYLSNGERETMIEAVLEFVGRQGSEGHVQRIEHRIAQRFASGMARSELLRELHKLKGALKLGRDEQLKALRLAYIECDSAGFEKRAREILGIAP